MSTNARTVPLAMRTASNPGQAAGRSRRRDGATVADETGLL